MFLPDHYINKNIGCLSKKYFKYESSKYWNQLFDFEQLKNDKKMKIMYSPLYNTRSSQNLNKIISFLKIKKKQDHKLVHHFIKEKYIN
jgi:hypothetical protein